MTYNVQVIINLRKIEYEKPTKSMDTHLVDLSLETVTLHQFTMTLNLN